MIKVLFLGDCVGRIGRRVYDQQVQCLRDEFHPTVVIANGENAAGGFGLDVKTSREIFDAGVDVITSGNHIWDRKEVSKVFSTSGNKVIRPLNYPKGAAGKGAYIFESEDGTKIGIINLIGRIFMPDGLDCPFRSAMSIVQEELSHCNAIFVDFHAEATSEKIALGYYLDGHVSAVVGTHTHVQTADDKILKGGTAFLSDVGMCGPDEGVIGMEKEEVIERFLSALPLKFQVRRTGNGILAGVLISINPDTGRATEILRILRHIEI